MQLQFQTDVERMQAEEEDLATQIVKQYQKGYTQLESRYQHNALGQEIDEAQDRQFAGEGFDEVNIGLQPQPVYDKKNLLKVTQNMKNKATYDARIRSQWVILIYARQMYATMIQNGTATTKLLLQKAMIVELTKMSRRSCYFCGGVAHFQDDKWLSNCYNTITKGAVSCRKHTQTGYEKFNCPTLQNIASHIPVEFKGNINRVRSILRQIKNTLKARVGIIPLQFDVSSEEIHPCSSQQTPMFVGFYQEESPFSKIITEIVNTKSQNRQIVFPGLALYIRVEKFLKMLGQIRCMYCMGCGHNSGPCTVRRFSSTIITNFIGGTTKANQLDTIFKSLKETHQLRIESEAFRSQFKWEYAIQPYVPDKANAGNGSSANNGGNAQSDQELLNQFQAHSKAAGAAQSKAAGASKEPPPKSSFDFQGGNTGQNKKDGANDMDINMCSIDEDQFNEVHQRIQQQAKSLVPTFTHDEMMKFMQKLELRNDVENVEYRQLNSHKDNHEMEVDTNYQSDEKPAIVINNNHKMAIGQSRYHDSIDEIEQKALNGYYSGSSDSSNEDSHSSLADHIDFHDPIKQTSFSTKKTPSNHKSVLIYHKNRSKKNRMQSQPHVDNSNSRIISQKSEEPEIAQISDLGHLKKPKAVSPHRNYARETFKTPQHQSDIHTQSTHSNPKDSNINNLDQFERQKQRAQEGFSMTKQTGPIDIHDAMVDNNELIDQEAIPNHIIIEPVTDEHILINQINGQSDIVPVDNKDMQPIKASLSKGSSFIQSRVAKPFDQMNMQPPEPSLPKGISKGSSFIPPKVAKTNVQQFQEKKPSLPKGISEGSSFIQPKFAKTNVQQFQEKKPEAKKLSKKQLSKKQHLNDVNQSYQTTSQREKNRTKQQQIGQDEQMSDQQINSASVQISDSGNSDGSKKRIYSATLKDDQNDASDYTDNILNDGQHTKYAQGPPAGRLNQTEKEFEEGMERKRQELQQRMDKKQQELQQQQQRLNEYQAMKARQKIQPDPLQGLMDGNEEMGGGGAEPNWEFGGGVIPLPVLQGAYDTCNATNNGGGGGAEPANEISIGEQYDMMMQNQSSLEDHRGGSGPQPGDENEGGQFEQNYSFEIGSQKKQPVAIENETNKSNIDRSKKSTRSKTPNVQILKKALDSVRKQAN